MKLTALIPHKIKSLQRRILMDFFGLGDDDGGSSGDSGSSSGRGGSGKKPNQQNFYIILLAVLIGISIISYMMRGAATQTKEVDYNQFVSMVDKGEVARVKIESDRIDIAPKTKAADNKNAPYRYYTGKVEDDDTLTKRLLEKDVIVRGEVQDSTAMIISLIVSYVLPLVLLWGLMSLIFRRMSRGGGMMGGPIKSNAKEYVQRETGVTFADVAGEDEAKESLQEVVDFLHNPGRYVKIGAKLPKGALLVGPPGTGKTLLAKAVAGEAHVPFFSLTGSDFIELYVGVGASRVRDLFKEATKNAPCIIFIDEIDAIGRSRDSKYGGGNEEREQTLNQLLSEMDGFDSAKGILVLGATNRPEILDKALLRPGRFDRRIIVDRPDLKGREAILKVHAKDVKMDETVDLNAIALATSGAVGSDLANMINEAAINAVKEHREYVSQKDLFEAVEQVLVGKEKKDRVMNAKERRIVSYHEVGHALINAVQKNSEPVQKITIVPRTMGALGYVMQVPEEEHYLNSKEELHDMIVGLLGGRAAEELKFGSITTGASNDIEKATGQTAAAVDEEVRRMIQECYEEAKAILRDNMDVMDEIADYLIKEETITGKQFMKIYRKAKGLPEEEEKTPEERLAEDVKQVREAAPDTEEPNAPSPAAAAQESSEPAALSSEKAPAETPAQPESPAPAQEEPAFFCPRQILRCFHRRY